MIYRIKILAITAICTLVVSLVFWQFTYRQICESEHISYTLVETCAETLNLSRKEVISVFHFAKERMEPVEAVMLLNSDLTEEEAAAIVTVSDLKQRDKSKKQD